MRYRSRRVCAPPRPLPGASLLVAIAMLIGAAAAAHAASPGPGAGLSPDQRPVLLLEPPHGALLLARHAVRLPVRQAESLAMKLGYRIAAPVIGRDREERRVALPSAWRTPEPDRGFGQALLMQLSQASANWPWRTLIVSSSGPESDSQLQSLMGQDAVIAVVQDELVDLAGKVELHVTMQLVTVRASATVHEARVRTQVEYFAPPLAADSTMPRRSQAHFVMSGPLDDQVSTAATDLSQFLATIVARVSVPDSLHRDNPVVYEQPGRLWIRVGKPAGTILALPVKAARR